MDVWFNIENPSSTDNNFGIQPLMSFVAAPPAISLTHVDIGSTGGWEHKGKGHETRESYRGNNDGRQFGHERERDVVQNGVDASSHVDLLMKHHCQLTSAFKSLLQPVIFESLAALSERMHTGSAQVLSLDISVQLRDIGAFPVDQRCGSKQRTRTLLFTE